TLFNQCRVTADKVNAHLLSGLIQSLSGINRVTVNACNNQRDRGDGDALVDDRNTQLGFDTLTHLNEVLSLSGYSVINSLAGLFHGGASTAQQGNTHGNGADIEAVFLNHLDGVKDAVCFKCHCECGSLYISFIAVNRSSDWIRMTCCVSSSTGFMRSWIF